MGLIGKSEKLRLRKCIVCGTMKEKRELLRLSEKKNGGIFFKLDFLQGYRGLYICIKKDCLKIFIENKKYRKRFISRMADDELNNMIDYINSL